ncbi:MAG: UvrD-helicase domain-containing protein [Bacteroidia bacterium]
MNAQYLDELNPVQREAVINTEGPVMIIAGAGSGKTRVLTYRIAHLLNHGVSAFNILSLTFTNKAAREMKERIYKIVGSTESANLWMGTFHSVFARILRFEAEKLGYPSNFTIYDTDDSKSLIKTILGEMNLDDKIYKPSLVLNRISNAKNNLISSQEYLNNKDITEEDRLSGKPKLGLVYEAYTMRCFKSSAMDFDDLLFKTNVLFRTYPEILLKYQDKFKYIMVDEYQDTNFSQYLIVKKLAARHLNICVVGDDAQSIYAFRGANIQNILNFERDYPELRMFKLEQNYRSTKTIVEAANGVIKQNKSQLKKVVWTDNQGGDKIKVYAASTDNEEGQLVVNRIFDLRMENQIAHQDFAILYRTNAQSRAMEEALRKRGVPYRIYGGLSFYKRKEIKDLLAYFRLTINPNDEEALKRIINYPARGIGKVTLEKIVVSAAEKGVSIWDFIAGMAENPSISGTVSKKIIDFVNMIKSFRHGLQSTDAYNLGLTIAKSSGLLKELSIDKTPEGISKHENVQELLNGIQEFVNTLPESEDEVADRTLDIYIRDIALLTDADEDDKSDPDKVSLMTIHAAKGLEFKSVFVVGLEENLFPSQLSLNSVEELEEERRLFYVAITRAETFLTLSHAETRYRWGQITHGEPSRFLLEIDPALIDSIEVPRSSGFIDFANDRMGYGGFEKKAPPPAFKPRNFGESNTAQAKPKPQFKPVDTVIQKQVNTFVADNLSGLQSGMQVVHERFGKGKVLNVEGRSGERKATVFFQEVGQKQLLLKFAKLKIVE